MVENFAVRLQHVKALSNSTRAFRFLSNTPVTFKPGQFYRFTFEDDRGAFERSYSLCNRTYTSAEEGILDLLISVVHQGRASQLLFKTAIEVLMKEGMLASVRGPFGRLLVPKQLPKRLFLVATSVGIAPYMSMLCQLGSALSRQTDTFSVHFLYGTRDKSEFVYGAELLSFARQHANFDLSVCYSRESLKQPRNYEFTGYVTDRISDLSPDPMTDYMLLCGHPGMVDDVFALLKAQGFNQRQVIREKYVFGSDTTVKQAAPLSAKQKKLIAAKMKQYQNVDRLKPICRDSTSK